MKWSWPITFFALAFAFGCGNAFVGDATGTIVCFFGAALWAFCLGMRANDALSTRMLNHRWYCGQNHRDCDPCPRGPA